MKLIFGKEFQTKYADTFITVRTCAGAEPRLFWITRGDYEIEDESFQLPFLSEDSSFCINGRFFVNDKWESDVIDITEYIIDLALPVVGYVNNGKGNALYVGQEPHKQWKRAMSKRVINVSNHHGHLKVLHDSLNMNNLFFPAYVPIEEAITSVLEGKHDSLAINKDYAIGLRNMEGAPPSVYLYHHAVLIGVVEDNEGAHKVLLPECCSYLLEDIEQFIECEVA